MPDNVEESTTGKQTSLFSSNVETLGLTFSIICGLSQVGVETSWGYVRGCFRKAKAGRSGLAQPPNSSSLPEN